LKIKAEGAQMALFGRSLSGLDPGQSASVFQAVALQLMTAVERMTIDGNETKA
jgi:hypothetical protein